MLTLEDVEHALLVRRVGVGVDEADTDRRDAVGQGHEPADGHAGVLAVNQAGGNKEAVAERA